MTVKIGSNIGALQAQRQLAKSSDELGTIYERLSSGQRINRASDDAAGLSISMSLSTQTRVSTQAIRNLNDGISYLSIADGAVQNLKEIVFRLHELSSQASNGTLGLKQRAALDKEAQQLSEEYGRIIETTSFNGVDIFSRAAGGGVKLQAGVGTDAILNASLQGGTIIRAGTGSFQSAISIADDAKVGTNARNILVADFNNDGNLDFGGYASETATFSLQIGNGDGTFREVRQAISGFSGIGIVVGDINQDGIADITENAFGLGLSVGLGRGDGTFQVSVTSVATPGVMATPLLEDINGDGKLDYVASTVGSNPTPVVVRLGNGDGTFLASTSFQSGANVSQLEVADFDGDGKKDLAIQGGGGLLIHYGNGNGTFGAGVTLSAAANRQLVDIGDVDGDGRADLVTGDLTGGTLITHLNTAGRTFSSVTSSISVVFPEGFQPGQLTDIDGDKILDIVNGTTSGIAFYKGVGDGTFSSRQISTSAFGRQDEVVLGDFNNDGISDAVSRTHYSAGRYVWLGQAANNNVNVSISKLLPLSLGDLYNAKQAQKIADDELTRLNAVSSIIGASMSRVSAAASVLQTTRQGLESANSIIRDVDIGETSAALAKQQILQQVGAAILGQANIAPQLALKLLQS